ncbi:MAG: hypothetical protein OXD43_05310 [Bacteroidetes bacterium]|nr:hypothetical protein [Bacteroidota bacterium]
MVKIYKWRHPNEDPRIAVGRDSLFASVYAVSYGVRSPQKPNLGQLIKFNAVDADTFEGPIKMTIAEVKKKYGPVIARGTIPPARLGENLMKNERGRYAKIGTEANFDLYRHKKDGYPMYAYLSPDGDWGIADKLADLKKLVREYGSIHFSLRISIYFRGGRVPTMDPLEFYRNVAIRGYLFQGQNEDVPKLVASVMPHKSREDLPEFFFKGTDAVEGNTIKEMRTKIDKTINSYPEQHRQLFK